MTEVDDPIVAQLTRIVQIIVGAMATGLLGFLLIVIFLVPPGEIQPQIAPGAPPALTYVALIFGTLVIIGSVALPKIVVAAGRRQLIAGKRLSATPTDLASSVPDKDLSELLTIFRTQVIVGAAMLEGVGMLAIVAYMLEHRPIALSLAIVMILGVATRIPTVSRMQQWLESQSELILQERQFAEG